MTKEIQTLFERADKIVRKRCLKTHFAIVRYDLFLEMAIKFATTHDANAEIVKAAVPLTLLKEKKAEKLIKRAGLEPNIRDTIRMAKNATAAPTHEIKESIVIANANGYSNVHPAGVFIWLTLFDGKTAADFETFLNEVETWLEKNFNAITFNEVKLELDGNFEAVKRLIRAAF